MQKEPINESKRIDRKILDTVEETIKTHNMFKSVDSVLIGVSGGSDSMALLHMLVEIASRWSLNLGVAHLNHDLRPPDSDNDAEFVASIADQLELPCYIQKSDVRAYQKANRLSLEDAARRLRYAFYHRVANTNDYNKIALGHHAEDNAELVLMYVLRGSGPRGISGIPPIRDGKIVRPLLNLRKSEILDFLASKQITYKTDVSNDDMKFLRNRIRHHLLPSLVSSYNPRIVDTLNRLSSITYAEEDWVEALITPMFNASVIAESNNEITLSTQALDALHIAAKRRIIRRAIRQVKGNLKRIRLSHIESVIRLLKSGSTYRSLDLPDRIRIYVKRGMLVVRQEKIPLRELNEDTRLSTSPTYSYSISTPGSIYIEEIDVHLMFSPIEANDLPKRFPSGHCVAFVDMDSLHFPLVVRNVQHGDRFTPFGMKGSQKVHRFFINTKTPKDERVKYPVVTDGDGKIVWVAGHRIDESFRVLPLSEKILKIELFLA